MQGCHIQSSFSPHLKNIPLTTHIFDLKLGSEFKAA